MPVHPPIGPRPPTADSSTLAALHAAVPEGDNTNPAQDCVDHLTRHAKLASHAADAPYVAPWA